MTDAGSPQSRDEQGRTALVLGGGGIVGIAWLTGLLLGLEREGITLRNADIIVGTSAGSVVGTQLTSGRSLEELYARQLEDATGEIAATVPGGGMEALAASAASAAAPQEIMRAIGQVALARGGGQAAERHEVIAARLPEHDWPAGGELRITAVDVDSGERTVFTRDSGVPLVSAVGASCAVPGVWPVVEIDGHRYMDGGIWSTANIDVAADASRLVVIAPLPFALRAGTGPDDQLAALQTPGVVIVPNRASAAAFGPNPLDPAGRRASAEAGLAQAAEETERIQALLTA